MLLGLLTLRPILRNNGASKATYVQIWITIHGVLLAPENMALCKSDSDKKGIPSMSQNFNICSLEPREGFGTAGNTKFQGSKDCKLKNGTCYLKRLGLELNACIPALIWYSYRLRKPILTPQNQRRNWPTPPYKFARSTIQGPFARLASFFSVLSSIMHSGKHLSRRRSK